MNACHHERPKGIRKSFHQIAPRIPDEAVSLDEIAGIPHGDHCIVKKEKRPFAGDFITSAPDKSHGVEEIQDDEEGKGLSERLKNPCLHGGNIEKTNATFKKESRISHPRIRKKAVVPLQRAASLSKNTI